ncbi:hypothetical protein D918_06142 [Trichuris suis]|nr:hypothetical protein D918_06142 [Trichuris suis]
MEDKPTIYYFRWLYALTIQCPFNGAHEGYAQLATIALVDGVAEGATTVADGTEAGTADGTMDHTDFGIVS